MTRDSRRLRYGAVALPAVVVFFAAPAAWAAESITLEFVRHGQAGDNLVINNEVPGPPLTELGQQQAQTVADLLADDGITGIYSSIMTRAHETADPLAELLGLPVHELAGLNEIDAGLLADLPVNVGGLPLGAVLYAAAPMLWAFGLYFVPQLGSSDFNGMVFQDRFSDAVAAIYAGSEGGDTDAVFAHEGSIVFWTLMNVDNPDFGIILNEALTTGELLPFTGVIEVRGNPEDGWTLVSWDGQPVAEDPGLLTELFVDVRDVITAPQMALFHIWEALLSGDPAVFLDVIQAGADDVGTAALQFPVEVLHDVLSAF
ncbi:histidine phosphatase family protein [Mycolicibacter heraklionensis]|uniref:Histidine phosphatase family protein n=1 Tax=Mycolicibacter heraklionensis TaxID=512402 RepID=A0A9X7ZEV3_9MYCO|nr:histidine phosphatase family protein [Mycolicibacter heraklionensis]QZA07369.1 histidine phosphatase family protein [Mycolicibacter heraklionensis]